MQTGHAVEGGPAMRAKDLAALLSEDIFDATSAARFLGIQRGSLEYAAYRRRIPHVRYGSKKLFTRSDLEDYRRDRGRGRESRLEDADNQVYEVPNA